MLRRSKTRRARTGRRQMAAAKKTVKTAKSAVKSTVDHVEDHSAEAFAFADTARDQYDAFVRRMSDASEEFRTKAEDATETMRATFDAAQEKVRAINTEMMEAAREEMTEAVEFANELARARSLGDAFEIQRNYWTKVFETRAAQMKRATEVSAEAAKEAFEPVAKMYAVPFSYGSFFPFAAK
jgi:hypothetical protein